MSLDVAYSYCTKLTDQQKLDIDKQVRKNQLELKLIVKFITSVSSFSSPMPTMQMAQFFPTPQEIV